MNNKRNKTDFYIYILIFIDFQDIPIFKEKEKIKIIIV